MQAALLFPVFEVKRVSEAAFVAFWSARYEDPREHLYKPNIGLPLTKTRLLQLFEWKNGGKIANHKLESILNNYVVNRPKAPLEGSREDHIRFITDSGGAIWRIFWLHCHSPSTYPIFDQHVYRAMRKILTGETQEIPATNPEKAIVYIDEYLPFYKRFNHKDKKQLDEALWSYGKYLKGRYAL